MINFKYMRKGSALLSTLMILFGVIVVAFFGLDIIMNGLTRRRAEGASEKALAAAEAGAERTFSAMRNYSSTFATCKENKTIEYYYDFAECLANPSIFNLNDNPLLPAYVVKVKYTDAATQDVQVISRGSYMGVAREIKATFCLPDCVNKADDANDGCSGTCVCPPVEGVATNCQ